MGFARLLEAHHSLLLPPAELHPALADHRVQPVRERLERRRELRGVRRRARLLPRRAVAAVGDVIEQGRVEERALLRDHRRRRAEGCEAHLAGVDACKGKGGGDDAAHTVESGRRTAARLFPFDENHKREASEADREIGEEAGTAETFPRFAGGPSPHRRR